MTLSARRYFQGASLAVWGVVALAFYFSGRLSSYLHPSFHGWTVFSGFVLVLMAAGVVLLPTNEECFDDDCGAAHGPKSGGGLVLTTALLIIPLLGAVMISPSQFGAVVVMNRGLADSIADLPGYVPFSEPPLPTEDGSIGPSGPGADFGSYLTKNANGQIVASTMDLLYAANEPGIRQDFENQEIEVIGQFFPARKNNPGGDRFSLVRMFVMCCAADARPVAITIRAPRPETFPDMSWVKVTGKATFPSEGGRTVPVIVADAVVPAEAPRETFVY
ncbi:MAG: TIGR03943 family protein [Terrimicrobiaceae bacterium]